MATRDPPLIGHLLQRLRTAAALSQEALAERAGLSVRAVSDLERGVHQAPRLETVRMLADALEAGETDRADLLLAARPELIAATAARGRPVATLSLPPTRLIGREQELAALRGLLITDGHRLVTLTGPGGTGKTRLAQAVVANLSDAFVDGIVFVDLAPLADPTLVLPQIAATLGVRETGASGSSLHDAVLAYLEGKRVLLLLDNCEHLLEGATVVGDLLAASAGLTILATSRSPLRLRGEREYALLPLRLPDLARLPALDQLSRVESVALFVQRAQASRPDFALTADNARAVAAVCVRLDGLPLAIELAAAWVRVLPSAALLERLEPRLPLLREGAADQPARLRTMRDAIAWSYDLLTPEEARLFRRLAVFVGGFSLEGMEAVARVPPSESESNSLDLLAALIDKSLLQVQTDGPDPRFLLLGTVREFALEQLAASGEAAAVAAAHAAHMAAFAEGAEPHLLGPEERTWRLRCDAELGNLRAALTWSLDHDNELALRIGTPLWLYWNWNLVAEGLRWLAAAVERMSDEPVLLRARAWTTHAALAILGGDGVTGAASAARAIPLANESGDAVVEGAARWVAACRRFFDGTLELAGPELDQALELLEQATSTTMRCQAAYARSHRGVVAFLNGDTALGIALYEDALARVRAASSDTDIIVLLGDFAGWLVDLEVVARARDLAQEALAVARAGDHVSWLLFSPLSTLALIAAIAGKAVTAARRIGAIDASVRLSGLALPPHYQLRIDRAAALARDALGEDEYAAALAGGRDDLQGVIDDALCDVAIADPAARFVPSNNIGLSSRQCEVLGLLASGRSDQQIAEELFISRRAVSNHVAAIMSKLDARSRGEAAVRGVRDGLI